MTHDTLRHIGQTLEDHQSAFQDQVGFGPGVGGAYYLGYGGPLTLPDGRPYEAYVRGSSEELRIGFTGPRLGASSLQAELGHVRIAIGDDCVWLSGESSETPELHNYPGVVQLVQPLGEWMAQNLDQNTRRDAQNAMIQEGRKQAAAELTKSILYPDEADELAVAKGAIDGLLAIIAAGRELRFDPITATPDDAETTFFDKFVGKSTNATAGLLRADEGGVRGLRLVRVSGPLLF